MRRLSASILWGLAVLLAACSGTTSADAPPSSSFTPEPPPTYAAEGLRLATLNTEFLFDGRGSEGGASFPWKGDPDAARAHRAEIGAIIRALDADLVMLQEVENEAVMDSLIAESLDGAGYASHFIEGRDTFTGQDVGLLARVPVDTVGRTDARAPVEGTSDTYGVSKNLFARLTIGNLPVTLIGLHFLANPSSEQRVPRREAQAEVIRQLAAAESAAGRAVVVLGDFNDYDADIPDIESNTPISNVLSIVRRNGKPEADDLRSVMADVSKDDRYTSHYDRDRDEVVDAPRELTAIDHIFLSPRLYERTREVTYAQFYDPTTHTDHFPIVVTLAVK